LKPILYVIGLGYGKFTDISLEIFRLLEKTRIVYTLNSEPLVVKEMAAAGICYRELFPAGEINDEEIGSALLASLKKDQHLPEQVVLALPGHPLAESKAVSNLKRTVGELFNVHTDFLVPDKSLVKLVEIMAELRSAKGCPWDKEQTFQSLRKYLIEETYEVIEAINANNMNNLCEELGDLLLQIVFQTTIAKEKGYFCLDDVVAGINKKLKRRHPHIFSSAIARSGEEVARNWERIKKQEKVSAGLPAEPANYFNIPEGLPALYKAEKTQKQASKAGFDWQRHDGPLAKIYEELSELEDELEVNRGRVEEELGDLLFSIVNLARFLNVDPEQALLNSTNKFQNRFNEMRKLVSEEGKIMEEMPLDKLDIYWEMTKKK
jgi:tetrapyrrole methylase family protein/MazG family protein